MFFKYTAAFLLCFAALYAAPLELVKNGKSDYVILLQPKALPATVKAAQEFKEYIKKATGADLPLIRDTKSSKPAVRIGFLKVAEPEGYIIKREGKDLHISGSDTPGNPEMIHWSKAVQTGSWYGVCAFLRQFAGVRWIFPGPYGEYVPKTKNLIVNIDTIKKQPFMEFRKFGPIYFKERSKSKLNKEIHIWARRNGTGYSRGFDGSHSWAFWERSTDLFLTHPEYFPLINGKRQAIGGQYMKICTTNPGALDTFARYIIQKQRKRTDVMQTLSPSDGLGFCECANCRALDTVNPDGSVSLTDRIVTYCNEMAKRVNKELPEQHFGLYAYSVFAEPPVKTVLSPNITVMNVKNSSSITYYIPAEREKHLKQLLSWRKRLKRLYFYTYPEGMGGLDMPCANAESIKELFKNLVKADIRGFSMNLSSSMGACGLNHYLYAQMSFDPLQDFDKLYADALQAAYGKNASLVRDYFADVENRLRRFVSQGVEENVGLGFARRIPDTFTRHTYKGLYEKWITPLRNAEKSEKDPGIKVRIGMLRLNLEYAETTRRLVLLAMDILGKKASKAAIDKAVKLATLREKQQSQMAALPDNHNIPYVKKRAEQFRLALDSAVFKIMQSGGVKETAALKVSGKVKLDGVLDEVFWKNAKPEIIESGMLDGKPFAVKSRFRAVVCGDELIIGFECDEPKMAFVSDSLRKNGSTVWNENNLDIFLDPSGKGDCCYHIISNSLGTLYTEKMLNGKAQKWQGKIRSAARHNKNSWSLELAIPLKEIAGRNNWEKAVWGFNCARVRRTVNPPEYSCWSCTFGKFNVPGRFGKIHFK